MEKKFEDLNMSFKKHTGKETEVRVMSEALINKGAFGNIFDTVIKIGHLEKRFIVKKYVQSDEYSNKDSAKQALRKYALVKGAGLKVFPTFRIGEDETSILMTTGFSKDQICIGSNNHFNVVHFKRPLIEKVIDEDKFLSTFFAEGLKAVKNGIKIYMDVVFFVLSKNEPTKIDFVLADLDNLHRAQPSYKNGLINMGNLRTMLIEFCNKNMDPVFAKYFLQKVEDYYEKGRASIDSSGLK